MATYSLEHLSETTKGEGILVATASPLDGSDTAVHTAPAGVKDEVWLWATNNHTAPVELWLGIEGTTDPNDVIRQTISNLEGKVRVLEGLLVSDGATIVAAAAIASEIVLWGKVQRVT